MYHGRDVLKRNSCDLTCKQNTSLTTGNPKEHGAYFLLPVKRNPKIGEPKTKQNKTRNAKGWSVGLTISISTVNSVTIKHTGVANGPKKACSGDAWRLQVGAGSFAKMALPGGQSKGTLRDRISMCGLENGVNLSFLRGFTPKSTNSNNKAPTVRWGTSNIERTIWNQAFGAGYTLLPTIREAWRQKDTNHMGSSRFWLPPVSKLGTPSLLGKS